MIYRKDKYGNEISELGFGCMRFSKKGTALDYEKAKSELLKAYEMGINYFDTAYIYSGSEELLGRFFQDTGLREKVNIATKLPQYMMRSREGIEKTFNEELKRLGTDYIDYYLMHMFTDIKEWENLQKYDIKGWIEEKKSTKAIRQIGFSYHGDSDMFLKILDAYDWDFCQIQYNYLDENSQAGRRGLEEAHRRGIPVIIMEPLRGGKLVNMLPQDAKKAMADSERGYSPAEWGLRWLWNQPGVTCVLSGMNSIEMVEENCRIASEAGVGDFTDDDMAMIEEVKKAIKSKEKVGCTGCRYCMPCPKGVDIPGNFFHYNMMYIEKKNSERFNFAQVMGMRDEPGFASQCIGCGKCEQHCPQHLPIRELLKQADKELRPFPYKVGIEVARRFLVHK